MSNSQLVVPSAQTNQIPYNVGNIKNPIINLRPSNPLPEDFAEMQKFGLNPYDRSPNDYLRFVANVFTAFALIEAIVKLYITVVWLTKLDSLYFINT